MRLLECVTKKVVEFVGDSVPRYAILSHTWEDKEDEVVFSDLENGTDYRSKKCWSKIERTCDQALRDGYSHVWIDTICIDKSSSAELSEAINSMFKWYRDAAVCYAYLSDVPVVSDNSNSERKVPVADMEHSRWFTRGWTLQEMIAPRELRFYDRDWTLLGTKANLLERIRAITGVDTRALTGGNLRFFSVARKMSWASKRLTTREEDIAYCLLGIFDISMPLLYGEGSRAFIRLQEQIIKEYDDESIFAWRSSDLLVYAVGVLASHPRHFAESANIVPCLTPTNMQTISGPAAVTSRGIRMEVPVERLEDETTIYLVRLNCKVLAIDRPSGDRVAIFVRPLANIVAHAVSASMYGRTRPNTLSSIFDPKPKAILRTIYLLKENSLADLVDFQVFLVRTMPEWPRDMDYRLHHVEGAWDRDHAILRQSKRTRVPLVLEFGRSWAERGEQYYDGFTVAFGTLSQPSSDHASIFDFPDGWVWCDAKYSSPTTSAPVWGLLSKKQYEIDDSSHVHSSVTICKGGIRLTCHVRPEIMSGVPMFCVDLLVRDERNRTPRLADHDAKAAP